MENTTPKNLLKTDCKVELASKTEIFKLEGGITVQVGSLPKLEIRKELIHLLQKNNNSFATKSGIMKGIH